MITLLLIHSLAVRAQSLPATNEDTIALPSSCSDINNCRTRWNIVWSCFTTIFLCTWVAIHPNIPEPVDDENMSISHRIIYKTTCFMRDKVPLFVCAMLIPEYILMWALLQRLQVRTIVNNSADLRLTTAHGFLMIMGGFQYFKPSEGNGDTNEMTELEAPLMVDSNPKSPEAEARPVHPLTHVDVISMVRKKQLILPLKSEIQDRSKSDWLAKTIILTQTLWFVVQCIARRLEHLPTTELEIVTLAYITINFGMSIAWWDKPRNVYRPIRVFQWPEERDTAEYEGRWLDFISGDQDDSVDLHLRRKVPIFYSGKPQNYEKTGSFFLMLVVGVIFGAIHCIAWSFEFSSSTQAFVWRFCSITIISVPFLLLISIIVLVMIPENARTGWLVLTVPAILTIPLSGILYVGCRLTTLVIALVNLSSLPPGALQTVYWTTLIPHV